MNTIRIPSTPKTRQSRQLMGPIAAGVLAAAMSIAWAGAPDAALSRAGEMEMEGLVKIDVPGVDQVHARRDADLSGYRKILLDPIEVSFRKDWNPNPGGFSVSATDKQEIREGLARVIQQEFTAELSRMGRYEVVQTPAEDTLRIKADIRDVYINAPDVTRPGYIRSYTMSTGELTLVADLRDAATGELIARVIDRRRDPESPWFELTTSVDNIAAARRAAAHWAGILCEQLDAANKVGMRHANDG
jgi:hypothetical protein